MVEMINDPAVHFGTQLWESKLLWNNKPNEVSVSCILAAAKCAMDVTMSWVHFLVEEFRVDCLEAQENRGHFHYSWMLILIAFIGWQKTQDSRFIEQFPDRCEATHYASLWNISKPKQQQEKNVCFIVYNINLSVGIRRMPRISEEIVAKYNHVTTFNGYMHQLFL